MYLSKLSRIKVFERIEYISLHSWFYVIKGNIFEKEIVVTSMIDLVHTFIIITIL